MTTDKKEARKLSRREALKVIAAATGAATVAVLPAAWKTPEVKAGTLPQMGQISRVNLTND